MYNNKMKKVTILLCFFDECFWDSLFCLFNGIVFLVLDEHEIFPMLFIGVDEYSFVISLPQFKGETSGLFSTVILIPLTKVFSFDTLVEDIPQPDESLRHSNLLGYLLLIIGCISNELMDKSFDDTEYD